VTVTGVVTVVTGRRCQDVPFQGSHGGLLHRLSVIPAADMKRAVNREQEHLLRCVPMHVAGLPALALFGLDDGTLD
jgi:hypothetical protein